jgi:hypothetical protein
LLSLLAQRLAYRGCGLLTQLREEAGKKRADERTRTADLSSLRVRFGKFAGVHGGSQTGISKPISPWAYAGELSRIYLHWCRNGVLPSGQPEVPGSGVLRTSPGRLQRSPIWGCTAPRDVVALSATSPHGSVGRGVQKMRLLQIEHRISVEQVAQTVMEEYL